MSMLLRIVGITAGLAAAGFAAGGAAGMVMAVVIEAADGYGGWLPDSGTLKMYGTFGGLVGALLGPLAAWLLMRHVPLWLAVGGTAAGTITGGVLGLLIGGFSASLEAALLGFAVAAVVLRLRGRRAIGAPDRPGIARARDGV